MHGLCLIVETKLGDESLVGIQIGGRAEVDLVNGLACCIEELQTAPNVVAFLLFNGKTMRPSIWKKPHIDLFAEQHGGMLADDRLVIDADLLMYGALIARERHDFTERFDFGEKSFDARTDTNDIDPAIGSNQVGFGNLQLLRKVALAHFRVIRPRLPDCVGCRFYSVSHVSSPLIQLFIQDQFALPGNFQPVKRTGMFDADFVGAIEENIATENADILLHRCGKIGAHRS